MNDSDLKEQRLRRTLKAVAERTPVGPGDESLWTRVPAATSQGHRLILVGAVAAVVIIAGFGLALAYGPRSSNTGGIRPGAKSTRKPLVSSTTVPRSSPTTTSTTTPGAAEVSPCGPEQLTTTASQASGAGGHLAVLITFTNNSSTPCTMDGYPTAWFVDARGNKMGNTSIEEEGIPAPTVVSLRHGARASTTVWYDNPSVPYPPCQTVSAAAIRVTPPGQSTSLVVNIPVSICGPPAYPTVGTTPLTFGTTETMF
jgi:hypothetical protein